MNPGRCSANRANGVLNSVTCGAVASVLSTRAGQFLKENRDNMKSFRIDIKMHIGNIMPAKQVCYLRRKWPRSQCFGSHPHPVAYRSRMGCQSPV